MHVDIEARAHQRGVRDGEWRKTSVVFLNHQGRAEPEAPWRKQRAQEVVVTWIDDIERKGERRGERKVQKRYAPLFERCYGSGWRSQARVSSPPGSPVGRRRGPSP
jgi:hypothetical protein